VQIVGGDLETHQTINPVLVWQEQELFPLTVEENLKIVSRDVRKVTELLDHFRLAEKRTSYASKLSGGEKEKLAIARALAVPNRKAVILDEPTQSIDPGFVKDVAWAILDIQNRGVTTVVITHDNQFVSLLSRGNPTTYVLQPCLKLQKQARYSELKGPYKLEDLFIKPSTLYAAQFAGFKNIYRIADPKHPVAIRNLYPVIEENLSGNLFFVVVPEDAFSISDMPAETSVGVELWSHEFRSNGARVAKYRWNPGSGIASLDFVLQVEPTRVPPEKIYLSLDGSRCIKIKAD